MFCTFFIFLIFSIEYFIYFAELRPNKSTLDDRISLDHLDDPKIRKIKISGNGFFVLFEEKLGKKMIFGRIFRKRAKLNIFLHRGVGEESAKRIEEYLNIREENRRVSRDNNPNNSKCSNKKRVNQKRALDDIRIKKFTDRVRNLQQLCQKPMVMPSEINHNRITDKLNIRSSAVFKLTPVLRREIYNLKKQAAYMGSVGSTLNQGGDNENRRVILIWRKIFSKNPKKFENENIGLEAENGGYGPPQWLNNRIDESEYEVMINPILLSSSERQIVDFEYCMAQLNKRQLVSRHHSIVVQYLDEDLRLLTRELVGFPARVFQHEYDHLSAMYFRTNFSEDGSNQKYGEVEDFEEFALTSAEFKKKMNKIDSKLEFLERARSRFEISLEEFEEQFDAVYEEKRVLIQEHLDEIERGLVVDLGGVEVSGSMLEGFYGKKGVNLNYFVTDSFVGDDVQKG